jgi:hypothetical protein
MTTMAELPAPLISQLVDIRARLRGSKNAVLPVIGSGLSRGLLSWTKLLEQLITEVREAERAGLLEDLAKDSTSRWRATSRICCTAAG